MNLLAGTRSVVALILCAIPSGAIAIADFPEIYPHPVPISETVASEPGGVVTFLGPDGVAMIAVTGYSSSGPTDHGVTIFRGDGDGSWKETQSFDVGRIVVDIAIGDVRGDALPDLVVAANNDAHGLVILRQYFPGHFVFDSMINPHVQQHGIAIGDVNGNGVNDIFVAGLFSRNRGWLDVALNGFSSPYPPEALGSRCTYASIGDADGDSYPNSFLLGRTRRSSHSMEMPARMASICRLRPQPPFRSGAPTRSSATWTLMAIRIW